MERVIENFSATPAPNAAGAVETFPRFSVEDDLLGEAPPMLANGQSGPTTRAVEPIRSRDGRVATGVWDSEAGVFEVNFTCDEVVHILEGEVRVTSNGATQTLRPGDVAYFRKGLRSTWDVPNYVRKVWFHHNPKPTIRKRVAYKLRMWSKRLLGKPPAWLSP